MTKVRITGWNEGLRKVALNKLLQRYAGSSLATAKAQVDAVLAGDEVVVCLESSDKAGEFVREAEMIGAKVEIGR